MQKWTQEEIAEMASADAEIEQNFNITLDEIAESRELDEVAIEGQLDFNDLKRQQYNRAYNKRYYTKNKAYLNARSRQYHAEHRERENERSRAWREKNNEYEKMWQKAYYDENRTLILAKKESEYAVKRAYRQIMRELEEES